MLPSLLFWHNEHFYKIRGSKNARAGKLCYDDVPEKISAGAGEDEREDGMG
jgi:hypothetical protein